MQLLVIRHGHAEDRAPDGRDASRRLTDDGRARMREIARGLRAQIANLTCIATSPLPRARETASILADLLGTAPPEPLALLAPGGDTKAVLDWLAQQPPTATIAVVGHEPDLSRLAARLVFGRVSAAIQMKKGAVCLIEFDADPAPGTGRLVFLMQPAQLQRLT